MSKTPECVCRCPERWLQSGILGARFWPSCLKDSTLPPLSYAQESGVSLSNLGRKHPGFLPGWENKVISWILRALRQIPSQSLLCSGLWHPHWEVVASLGLCHAWQSAPSCLPCLQTLPALVPLFISSPASKIVLTFPVAVSFPTLFPCDFILLFFLFLLSFAKNQSRGISKEFFLPC